MEIEKLRSAAFRALESAKTDLQRDGRLAPHAVLIQTDGTLMPVVFPPQYMDHPETKELLFAVVRQVARNLNVEATVWVTDANYFHTRLDDPDQIARFGSVEKLRDYLRGKSMAQLEAAGFGKMSQAVQVAVNTPIWGLQIVQEYESSPDRKQITFTKEPIVLDTADGASIQGRLSGYGDGADATVHSC